VGGTRTVTVLFTDLVGSTALSSRLEPAAADWLRESHFALLRAEVAATGGTVVKSLGDGLMVAFDSARAALSCAVRMQQVMERHNRTAEEVLAVRIGMATGEATESEDDFFGDPVVTAARLCAVASGDQILATDVVRLLAGRHVGLELVDIGLLELKGLPEPVSCIEVRWEPASTEPLAVPLTARLEAGTSEAFVGRAEELAALFDALKGTGTERRRRVVLVGGEPGIGKTSLAAVFARSARDEGSSVVYGRCDEDLGIPYQPWSEAVSHLIDHSPPDLLDEVLASHGADLSRLGPSLARLADGVGGSSDPETSRYLLFGAVVKVLQAAGRDRPVVVVLDDLQWADVPSLQLLRHVVSSDQAMSVLVIGTFRASEVTAGHPLSDVLAWLHNEPGVTRLHLHGLNDAELLTLLEADAGETIDEAGVALRDALGRETDGNPFFVGELLRHLTETGLIHRDLDGRWAVSDELPERASRSAYGR
jgi:class 3 adenylate cyclase